MFYLVRVQCCGQYRLRSDAAGAASCHSISGAGCRSGTNVLENEFLTGDNTCSTPCFESSGCGIDSLFEFRASCLGNSCEHCLRRLEQNALDIMK